MIIKFEVCLVYFKCSLLIWSDHLSWKGGGCRPSSLKLNTWRKLNSKWRTIEHILGFFLIPATSFTLFFLLSFCLFPLLFLLFSLSLSILLVPVVAHSLLPGNMHDGTMQNYPLFLLTMVSSWQQKRNKQTAKTKMKK